jgi:hypothetical protein
LRKGSNLEEFKNISLDKYMNRGRNLIKKSLTCNNCVSLWSAVYGHNTQCSHQVIGMSATSNISFLCVENIQNLFYYVFQNLLLIVVNHNLSAVPQSIRSYFSHSTATLYLLALLLHLTYFPYFLLECLFR